MRRKKGSVLVITTIIMGVVITIALSASTITLNRFKLLNDKNNYLDHSEEDKRTLNIISALKKKVLDNDVDIDNVNTGLGYVEVNGNKYPIILEIDNDKICKGNDEIKVFILKSGSTYYEKTFSYTFEEETLRLKYEKKKEVLI